MPFTFLILFLAETIEARRNSMSTIDMEQVLIPKKVHIGDTAELRCTFHTDSPSLQTITEKGTARLSTDVFETEINTDIMEVLNIYLSATGSNYYQLNITFIPWSVGIIKFPNINIGSISISVKPEHIVSLSEEYKTTALKDVAPPLLLPGTSYKLYGSIVLGLILIIAGISAVAKRRQLCFFIKNKILQLKYKKNKKETIKKLLIIKNESEGTYNDKETAGHIQNILRHYLEFRFSYPFTSVITSELVQVFHSITKELLSADKYTAFEEIASSFIRTDYIRYSNDKCSSNSFINGEKTSLIDNLVKNIEILEHAEETAYPKNNKSLNNNTEGE